MTQVIKSRHFWYIKGACELNKSHIISTVTDPGVRIESFAVINYVVFPQTKSMVCFIAMQSYTQNLFLDFLQIYFIFARFCQFQKLFEKKTRELLKEGSKDAHVKLKVIFFGDFSIIKNSLNLCRIDLFLEKCCFSNKWKRK
jgi:hypothetical protein